MEMIIVSCVTAVEKSYEPRTNKKNLAVALNYLDLSEIYTFTVRVIIWAT
jgi:hypothetical protein